jgi:hypothetical protein
MRAGGAPGAPLAVNARRCGRAPSRPTGAGRLKRRMRCERVVASRGAAARGSRAMRSSSSRSSAGARASRAGPGSRTRRGFRHSTRRAGASRRLGKLESARNGVEPGHRRAAASLALTGSRRLRQYQCAAPIRLDRPRGDSGRRATRPASGEAAGSPCRGMAAARERASRRLGDGRGTTGADRRPCGPGTVPRAIALAAARGGFVAQYNARGSKSAS